MNTNATIVCQQCQKRVNLTFRRVYTPAREHWAGTCVCGALNYIYRPSWDQQPLFRKYTREYLSEVTGYALEYLSRIATGKVPLGRVFIDRCCYTLKEPEEKLFRTE